LHRFPPWLQVPVLGVQHAACNLATTAGLFLFALLRAMRVFVVAASEAADTDVTGLKSIGTAEMVFQRLIRISFSSITRRHSMCGSDSQTVNLRAQL
jgi:hypothetical protein